MMHVELSFLIWPLLELWKNKIGARGVAGTDITNTAVRNLKRKYPHDDFYRTDISSEEDIQFLMTKRYDVVSAFDVLFHIVDGDGYERAIKNIHLLLKPNGIFVFSDNFLHGYISIRWVNYFWRQCLQADRMLIGK